MFIASYSAAQRFAGSPLPKLFSRRALPSCLIKIDNTGMILIVNKKVLMANVVVYDAMSRKIMKNFSLYWY